MRTNRPVMILVAFLFSWLGVMATVWPEEIKTVVPSKKIAAPPAAEPKKVTPQVKDVSPQVIVTSPSEGETWYGGETRDIQWSTLAIPESSKIRIEFIRSDTAKFILGDNLPRSGKFSWKIGQGYFLSTKVSGGVLAGTVDWPLNTKGTLKVTASSEGKTYGVERSISLLVRAIKITSPKEGDVWQVGKTYVVSWQNIGPAVSNVRIQISKGWGPLYDKLVANTGSASITVPTVDHTDNWPLGLYSDGMSFPERFIHDRVAIKIMK